jgi:hypothetical protein
LRRPRTTSSAPERSTPRAPSTSAAEPATTFTVYRRVDFNPDGVCTGAVWMTLPPPNEQTLTTSSGGAGALHFEISRDAPPLDGVSFDVQWRLAMADGSSILESDCFTVTVK